MLIVGKEAEPNNRVLDPFHAIAIFGEVGDNGIHDIQETTFPSMGNEDVSLPNSGVILNFQPLAKGRLT